MKPKMMANFEEALGAEINLDTTKQVEIIIDYLIPDELPKPIPPDTIRFVVTIQPEGHFNELIRRYQDNYDYLLTFIPELLTLPRAYFFIGLTNFVEPNPSTDKIFGVSCVFSARNCCPGHKLRHELWRRQDEISIPKFFFTGLRSGMTGGIPLPAEKRAKEIAMRTMFHIAIDSYDYDNSFSEKLIDPLISKVLPIYWGAGNVKEFFDMDGIVQIYNVQQIIDVCNMLDVDHYYNYQNNIEKNYKSALMYTDYGKQLQRKINLILHANS
jgi:hypothetical protein